MDRVISYKGFEIRAFEQGADRWFAEIRKANGAWIIVRGERRELVTTSAACSTANAALDLAIDAIDAINGRRSADVRHGPGLRPRRDTSELR